MVRDITKHHKINRMEVVVGMGDEGAIKPNIVINLKTKDEVINRVSLMAQAVVINRVSLMAQAVVINRVSLMAQAVVMVGDNRVTIQVGVIRGDIHHRDQAEGSTEEHHRTNMVEDKQACDLTNVGIVVRIIH
jgi:hypothetical protein